MITSMQRSAIVIFRKSTLEPFANSETQCIKTSTLGSKIRGPLINPYFYAIMYYKV